MSDMLENILAPIAPLTCNANSASANSQNSPRKITEAISEDGSTPTSKNGPEEKSSRFRIKKPWLNCLAENKAVWKEQAARGKSVCREGTLNCKTRSH